MKELIFSIDKNKVRSYVWLIVLTNVALLLLDIFIIPKINNYPIKSIVGFTLIMGIITFPGLFVHFNYMTYSKGKEFVVKYETIEVFENGTLLNKIISSKIVGVELHSGLNNSKLPWADYNYFKLIDESENEIIVPCYILSLSDFWLAGLTRKVSNENIKRFQHFLPLIQEGVKKN